MGRAIDTAAPTCAIKGMTGEILPWTGESMDYMETYRMTPEEEIRFSFSSKKGVYDFEDFYESQRMNLVEEMGRESDAFLASLGYEREGIFYRIKEKNEESIAVFCHGGFGCAWISYLLGMAPGVMYPQISLNTSSVTTFVFPNDEKGYTRPILKRLGEIEHIRKAGLRINNR